METSNIENCFGLGRESPFDYYNHEGYYLIIIQTLVDFRGLFLDVYIGWPGKVHDSPVFANSALYEKGSNGMLFPDDMKKNVHVVDVALVILHTLHSHC